jgi:hypothetical protein
MKAFPSSEPIHGDDVIGVKQSYGMELRDYFAAKAMQGLCTQKMSTTGVVVMAYVIADAMMKARKPE